MTIPAKTAALALLLVLPSCSDSTSPVPEPREPQLAGFITAGEDYACALVGGGSVLCTGLLEGVTGGSLDGYVVLSGGRQHACGIHQDGFARCWGVPSHGRTLVPFGTTFNEVVAGTLHGCGLLPSGSIVCWGNDEFGQLDAPRTAGFRQIAASAGGHHTCALTFEGAVTCWGLGDRGQTDGLDGAGYTNLVATANGGCALDAARAIHCWNDPALAEIPGDGYSGLVAGPDYVCALRDQAVHCFGSGAATFDGPPEGNNFKQVAAGFRHLCALRRDGHVICRGAVEAFPGVAQ